MGAAENFPCAGCRDAGPRAYRRIYAAAHYEGAIAEAIKMLKFHDRRRIANALAELMAEFAEREMPYEFYDDLVPVPLHRVRIRGRGFNQAELLAVRLLPQFPNAKMSEALRRIRPTRVQSRIEDRVERVRNVAGAFAVDRDVNLEGRTILLIDDVSTTGGTVNECAAALKRAGAHEVDVLVAAAPVEGGPGRSLLPASVGMGRMRATGGKRDD